MQALQHECLQPANHSSAPNQPYILSLVGGKEMSREGKNLGFTHVFNVTFANMRDRDYYVREDEAHLRFSRSLKGTGVEVMVVDFEEGVGF